MKRLLTTLVVVVVALAGCEKAGLKGSGALSASDRELFKLLPKGEIALFGGNYMKLESFMTSLGGKATADMMERVGPGMTTWTECVWGSRKVAVAGGLGLSDRAFELRLVFKAGGIPELSSCAAKAGFKAAPDADGKFVAIEVPTPNGPVAQGYLALPDGAVYSRQGMAMVGALPTALPATRAELEADIAALSRGTSLEDATLLALAEKTDRTKTVWFVGTGASTPLAGKLGDVYGTFDLGPGLAVDVTAQILDERSRKQLDAGIDQAKKMSGSMPPEVKGIIDGLDYHRTDDRVHLGLKVSDSQLAKLMQLIGKAR